jgi:hypothetical protein
MPVAGLVLAGCSSSEPKPQAARQSVAPATGTQLPPAAQSLARGPRFLADDLPLLPESLMAARNPPEVIRASYLFAARHPEVLNYIPCFCGCERAGHKGSHDCFVASRRGNGQVTAWDSHGITCDVCLDVAYSSMQMHNTGFDVAAIRAAIDKKYKNAGDGHGHVTPTPKPPKSGTGGRP